MERGYRALVVDDEMMVRDLTTRALSLEGIDCSCAADGREALKLLKQKKYDVVITDLRMPNMHGHALAVEILKDPDHPPVIVLTGVSEPRLAKDLLAHGIADIIFKPANFDVLALKVVRLLEQRSATRRDTATKTVKPNGAADDSAANAPPAPRENAAPVDNAAAAEQEHILTRDDVDQALQRAPLVMPVSKAALDVYTMAQSSDFDAHAIATAIQKHERLSQEIIRLANTLFYSPAKERTDNLEQCVVRIGTKRVGQLALAANALAALRDRKSIPSLDIGRIWRHSVAAGLAIELLVKQGGHAAIDEGLLLCATMRSLGHMVLAELFPTEYEHMMRSSVSTQQPLVEIERRILGKTHLDAMMCVLDEWGVPATLYAPLEYVDRDYYEISKCDEPLRSQVELVKLATLIAHIAVKAWHGWDVLELPLERTLQHLHITDPSEIISRVGASRDGINSFGTAKAAPSTGTSTPIAYYRPECESYDFLAKVLASLDIPTFELDDLSNRRGALIANCVGLQAGHDSDLMQICAQDDVVTITDTTHALSYEKLTTPLVLPTSVASLLSFCQSPTHLAAGAAQ